MLAGYAQKSNKARMVGEGTETQKHDLFFTTRAWEAQLAGPQVQSV